MSASSFEEGAFEKALASLRAHYLERIDAAVAAGRMDLVRELADGYEDEALKLMLSVEGGTPSHAGHGNAEILELGPVRPRREGMGGGRFRFWRHKKH
jgi:hypothetical protein